LKARLTDALTAAYSRDESESSMRYIENGRKLPVKVLHETTSNPWAVRLSWLENAYYSQGGRF